MIFAMFDSIRVLRIPPLFFVLAITVSACDSTSEESIACTEEVTPAIEAEVRNAETGAPEAEGAVAVATDGAYADTLDAAKSEEYRGELVLISLAGAGERPGTYDVVVEKQGFTTWTRTGVEPDVGECGVQTETLEAELVPSQ
jgi:hypothetical protein